MGNYKIFSQKIHSDLIQILSISPSAAHTPSPAPRDSKKQRKAPLLVSIRRIRVCTVKEMFCLLHRWM